MKENLICAILMVIAMACFIAAAILYAISGHWVIAVLYMVCVSLDGITAYRHFTLWWKMRKTLKEIGV